MGKPPEQKCGGGIKSGMCGPLGMRRDSKERRSSICKGQKVMSEGWDWVCGGGGGGGVSL